MKLQRKESDIVNSICEYLKAKNIIFFRINTIPVFDPTRKAFRRMPKYALKGVADIFILLPDKTIACEVKSENGTVSDAQIEFAKIWSSSLASRYYCVVRSIDELIKLGLGI